MNNEKKNVRLTYKDLEQLMGDELPAIPEGMTGAALIAYKNQVINEYKVNANDFVSGSLKYPKETLIKQYELMIEWYKANEDMIFLTEYYHDSQTVKLVPLGSLKKSAHRHPEVDEMKAALTSILEVRIFKMGWSRVKDSGLTKFLLSNNFGWKEKSESEVTVTNKEILFNFGNTELNEKETIDED